MAFAEDLSVFFNVDEFGDAAGLFVNGVGLAVAGSVIFDRNGMLLEEFDVEVNGPSVIVPTGQWSGPKEADEIEVYLSTGTERFRVRDARSLKDGAITLLVLAKL